jgi:2-methylcitrate dehydratase PrpD
VSEGHYQLLCKPEDAKLNPRNPVDAQFSIPWGVATAILWRKVNLEDFTDKAIKNKDILDLTKKMSIKVDSALNRPVNIEPTRVEITTTQGNVYSKEVAHPLGSLERPMSFDDCATKFRDCAKQLSKEHTDRVIEFIGQLEQMADIKKLINLLSLE